MTKITRGGMMATITGCLLTSMSLSAQDIRLDLIADGFTPNQSIDKTTEKPATQQVVLKAGAGTTFPVDIPDDDPTGVDIEIDASGFFTGNIESLTFELEIEHNWVGDLSATLTAPNGIAQLVLFSRTGRTPDDNNGYGSDLTGTYTFNDQATKDFWIAADIDSGNDIMEGTYRTSTGGTDLSRFGGCTTRLNGAFKGLTPAQTNGIWTLNISDNDASITGQVLSVGLLADQNNDLIFRSGFEAVEFAPLQFLPASDVLGNCKKAQFDFTGNGLSDYTTTWDSNDNFHIQTVTNTGNDTTGSDSNFILSQTSLNPMITSGGDFDGDGITDIVVRVDNTIGGFDFLIRRSSRPNDLWIKQSTSIDFHNPQFGDYDGDGLDDLAWFVVPESVPGNAAMYIINSMNLQFSTFDIGFGIESNFRAAGGFDHTGDGIADIFLMVEGPLNGQVAKLFDGTDGSLLLDSVSPRYNAFVRQLPGSYLDDVRAGTGVFVTVNADDYLFAIGQDNDPLFPDLSLANLGMDPTDFPITGDYDGDGIDDFGVWRPDTDGLGNRFIIRPSGSVDPDNNLIEVSPFEAFDSDYPLGNVRVR